MDTTSPRVENKNSKPHVGIHQETVRNQSGDSVFPAHLTWSFGEGSAKSPVEAKSTIMRIHLHPISPFVQSGKKETSNGFELPNLQKLSFRETVFLSLEQVREAAGEKRIALFHGGGLKSEILFRSLLQLGIPFDVFFLSFWDRNSLWWETRVQSLCQQHGIAHYKIPMSKASFYAHSKKYFFDFGVEAPNSLAMLYLADHVLEQFGESYFPLAGMGGLDRRGSLYESILCAAPLEQRESPYVPFSSLHVLPYLWKQKYKKAGELAFFQSNFLLFASALRSGNDLLKFPLLDLRPLYLREFAEVNDREPSHNFDGPSGERENYFFRKSLERLAHVTPGFSYWKKLSGCMVSLETALTFGETI